MGDHAELPRLGIVIAGHVDHGKSTVVGRLLADAGGLPKGKLEQVRAMCERTARPFEYAFLLDALKDERAQGITIDAARVFFRSSRREYVIIDAPGHVEFLKNMVSGASRADAALLVVDAHEGIQENSRRHGYLLSMLGLEQVAVLVNKMDLVGHREAAFRDIERELTAFLQKVGLRPTCFIPVSGKDGDNLTSSSSAMSWYQGPTVLQALDAFSAPHPPDAAPFRMWVQDVYKFTEAGDRRRIVAGTVDAGSLSPGDEVVFFPSGKRSTVATLEAFHRAPPAAAQAGAAVGFTLSPQIFVQRGELAARAGQEEPRVTSRLRASVFWLAKQPLQKSHEYLFKVGTARVPMQLEEVLRVMDASDLSASQRQEVGRHEVAECTFKLARACAFDLASVLPPTARFVIVEDYEIRGGGLVREALEDRQAWMREKVLLRNRKWESSAVPAPARATRFGHAAAMLVITGPRGPDRKTLARALELSLFQAGRAVYFLGIGNLLYGVDADLPREPSHRLEHLRRLAEVANIVLEAGLLLVVTAAELTEDEVELIRTGVLDHRVEVVWLGDDAPTDVECSCHLSPSEALPVQVARLEQLLAERGVLLPPGASEG